MTPPLNHAQDIVAIQQVLAAYCFAIDAKDYDALDTIFIPDAWIDYTATGGISGHYPEIKKWLASVLADFPWSQHLIGMPLIQIDGDTAKVRTMLFNPMQQNGTPMFLLGASYVDDCVRINGSWRIARRAQADCWVHNMPPDVKS